jgi:hypothetical protein
MPVVTFTVASPHIYIDTNSTSFKKNFYVGLLQESVNENGQKTANFEEFVPCSEVENERGFLPYNYSELYDSPVNIPTLSQRHFDEINVVH